MTQIDFLKLASQGRAFDATRAWTEEELHALEALTAHGLERKQAAEYIRNGITTVAHYEAAVKAGLEPKSLEVLRAEAVDAHQKDMRAKLGIPEVEAEEVSETEEVAETEVEATVEESAEAETEAVGETEEVVETEAETEAEPKAETSNKRGGKSK